MLVELTVKDIVALRNGLRHRMGQVENCLALDSEEAPIREGWQRRLDYYRMLEKRLTAALDAI